MAEEFEYLRVRPMRAFIQTAIVEAKRVTKERRGPSLESLMQPHLGRQVRAATISDWVTGKKAPRAEEFLAAVKASGISLDLILYGGAIPPSGPLADVYRRLDSIESRLPPMDDKSNG